MKKEVKTKPIAHIYAFAAVWLIWGLFLPLYLLWHFLVLIVVSVAVGYVFSRIFPGKTVYVTVPEPEPEPFTTGDAEVDALIREGELAVAEMYRLKETIGDPEIGEKISQIIEVSQKIVGNVQQDPGHFDGVKRFLNYYLPTTIKLLNAYDRMYAQGISGENITGTMGRISDALDTMIEAYNRQLDSLFAGQALDIETDIQVIEGFLKREGLTGSDINNTDPAGDTN